MLKKKSNIPKFIVINGITINVNNIVFIDKNYDWTLDESGKTNGKSIIRNYTIYFGTPIVSSDEYHSIIISIEQYNDLCNILGTNIKVINKQI